MPSNSWRCQQRQLWCAHCHHRSIARYSATKYPVARDCNRQTCAPHRDGVSILLDAHPLKLGTWQALVVFCEMRIYVGSVLYPHSFPHFSQVSSNSGPLKVPPQQQYPRQVITASCGLAHAVMSDVKVGLHWGSGLQELAVCSVRHWNACAERRTKQSSLSVRGV